MHNTNTPAKLRRGEGDEHTDVKEGGVGGVLLRRAAM